MTEATATIVEDFMKDKPLAALDVILPDDKPPQQEQTNGQGSNQSAYIPPFIPPNDSVFDSAFHCVDERGQPRKNKDGSFRRKPGRKTGGATVADHVQQAAGNPIEMEAAATAAALVSVLFIFGYIIGGDEWTPRVDIANGVNEPEFLTLAWKEYFIKCGGIALPMWLAPIVATLAYAAPRFTQPKTQAKGKRFMSWVGGLFKRKKKNVFNS